MSNKTEKPITCPLCGGEIKICKGMKLHSGYEIIYDWVEFECLKDSCQMNIHFDNFDRGITIAEALKRFNQRPESAWEYLRHLLGKYKIAFEKALQVKLKATSILAAFYLLLNEYSNQQAINIMQQIEKELKDDHKTP